MSLADDPTEIRVGWPGGKMTTGKIPKSTNEIIIGPDG
jgi:hypothetical protein